MPSRDGRAPPSSSSSPSVSRRSSSSADRSSPRSSSTSHTTSLPAFWFHDGMRAVLLERYGGPDVLRIAEVATPEPKLGEVRVRIDAIGINFAEVLSRTGTYSWAPPLPYIPGMEACGVVEETGEHVLVIGQHGAYAEAICVPARQALRPPAGYSTHEAAAFAVNYLTAWVGLMEMARLRPSATLLVTESAAGTRFPSYDSTTRVLPTQP